MSLDAPLCTRTHFIYREPNPSHIQMPEQTTNTSAIVTLSVILYAVILRPSGYSLMRGGFLPEETLAKRAVIEGISAVPEEMS